MTETGGFAVNGICGEGDFQRQGADRGVRCFTESFSQSTELEGGTSQFTLLL